MSLRILFIAVQVDLISTSAEQFRWKNFAYGREEVGCEGGRVCRGDAELSSGRLVGEGFPWSGSSTSDVVRMGLGDGGCVAGSVNFLVKKKS